jgi:feruloyl esterase
LNASGGGLPGILQAGGNSPVQAQSTSPEFDVDRAAARLVADVAGRMGDSTWTNLNTFRDHGGKLIFYHGMADPWFSALDTVDYYERMSEANGGMDAVREWSRAFVVPGMGHCSGGAVTADRFDMLTAIVDWVENGTAPDAVVATGSGGTRPLCPYPQYPHYTGGATDDPASYECRE